MFKKPFKVRSQNQLKNSEKKKFGSDLKLMFPSLTDDDISSIANSKENIVRIKILTFKDEDVDIYCSNKTPLYIDVVDSGIKLPTVFMIWKFPHMMPMLTTNSVVLNKLKNGADLFFPGIYLDGLLLSSMDFKKNGPIGVNLIDNKAAVAVGLSLVDKVNVVDENKNKDVGKLVKVYHLAGDYLYKMQSDTPVVQLGPPDWTKQVKEDPKAEDECEEDVSVECEQSTVQDLNQKLDSVELSSAGTLSPNQQGEDAEEPDKDSPDELLEYCFFKAVKTLPKTTYPILPAVFYAKHIIGNLPEGKSLNLKKTKWKKFSTFLQEKSLENVIKLQQLPKNTADFTIAGANTSHERVKSFVDPYNLVSVVVDANSSNKPVVQQVYAVSAATLPFFNRFGLKKHDELTRNDVRNHLNDYIKSENLADPNKPELVILDPVLFHMLKGDEVVSRVNLLTGVLSKMTVQHKVSGCGNGETILHKGKMPLIEFETCLRTGNKKVTLISNLESYGINVNTFSKELQHKAAASTTLIPSVPGKKGPQIQVQGNQVAVAFAILKEKYNMTEKSMKGLEKAVKSKDKSKR